MNRAIAAMDRLNVLLIPLHSSTRLVSGWKQLQVRLQIRLKKSSSLSGAAAQKMIYAMVSPNGHVIFVMTNDVRTGCKKGELRRSAEDQQTKEL